MKIRQSILVVASFACLAWVLTGNGNMASAQQLVDKACGRCGASVGLSASVGQNCPRCGAYWGAQRDRYIQGVSQQTHSHEEDSDHSSEPEIQPPESIQSPTAKYTLERTEDRRFVRVLDHAGEHILTLPHDGKLCQGLFSPKEDAVLTMASGAAWMFDLPTGLRRFQVSHADTSDVRFMSILGEPTIVVRRSSLLYFRNLDGKLTHLRIAARTGGTFREVILRSHDQGTRIFTVEADGWTRVYELPLPASKLARQ